MSWNTRHALLLLLVVLGCTGWMLGASQNAVIYGTVYNVASNPMPDVTVVLENKALGITRTTVTGSDGSYTFTEVPPADNYSVTAKQGGRTLDQRAGVTVNVGDERVILPPLTEQPAVAAGTGGEAKPVAKPTRGAAPTVRNETITTAISGVVTGDQLRALPLYNRNFLVLGLITPNAHDTEPASALAGASFSVSGARPSQNDFLLDGAENVATSSNQAIPFQVNDSIQEFRVISSTASAEYGRNLGGTVNVVTKRAGNAFHGSAYGYFGSESLNSDNPLSVYNNTTFNKAAAYAGYDSSGNVITTPINKTDLTNLNILQAYTPYNYNQYVANAQAAGYCTDSITPGFLGGAPADACAGVGGLNTPFDPKQILRDHDQFKQPFTSYQFGASAGGALIKDKWFVFGSYEGTIINNPNPILERVPSTFDRTYDPNGTGAFFFGPGNPNFVLAQNILGLFPASNINTVGSGAVPGALEFYQGQAPNYTHVHNFLFRTDYVKSEKTTLSLRYVAQFLKQLHDDSLPEGGTYPGNGAFRDAVNQNATLAITHSLSPKVNNELRFTYSRFDLGETPQDAGFDPRSVGLDYSQMPTILLNGIDPQNSGAMTSFAAVAPANPNDTQGLGASASWLDVSGCNTVAQCAATPPNSTMFPWSDGRFPMARLGAPLGAPSERRDSTFGVSNNVSWSHGTHSIKFGFEFRHLDNDLSNGALARGLVYSGNIGEFTSDSDTCNFDVNVTGGCVNQAFFFPSVDFAQFNPHYAGKFSSFALGGFAQDSWRVHKHVTINYGLRYEYFSVPNELNNNIWNYDPVANGLVQQNGTSIVDPYGNTCGGSNPNVGVLSSFYPANFPGIPGFTAVTNWTDGNGCEATTSGDYNRIGRSNKLNFAPRVGLAWNLWGDEVAHPTVIRFGAGLYYDQSPVNTVSAMLYNQPMSSPNVHLGQVFSGVDGSSFGFLFGICGGGYYQCGVGNQIINPAFQNSPAIFDPGNQNNFYTAIRQPSSIYARDTVNSGTPHAWQASFSVQQQLTSKMTMEVGYVGLFSDNLPAIYDRNYANEWGHVRSVPSGPSATSNVFFDNISNIPIYTLTNQADGRYHALMARLRTSGWHGLRFNVNYSYSRSMDNSSTGQFPTLPISPRGLLLATGYFGNSSFPAAALLLGSAFGALPATAYNSAPVYPNIDFGAGALTTTGAGQVLVSPYLIPQDPFNWGRNDWGRSDFDSKHRLTVDYVWETKSSSKWLDMWTFSGVFTGQSGQPFSIFGGPIAGAINQRAELGVPPSEITITSDPNAAIDPTQFIFLLNGVCPTNLAANNVSTFMPLPGQACTGRSGRNSFIGPKYFNLNLGVQKAFNVMGEEKKLYLRAEFFNLLNRANYYNPISSIADNGITTSANFGKILSAHDPRQIQLAVRFSW